MSISEELGKKVLTHGTQKNCNEDSDLTRDTKQSILDEHNPLPGFTKVMYHAFGDLGEMMSQSITDHRQSGKIYYTANELCFTGIMSYAMDFNSGRHISSTLQISILSIILRR